MLKMSCVQHVWVEIVNLVFAKLASCNSHCFLLIYIVTLNMHAFISGIKKSAQ